MENVFVVLGDPASHTPMAAGFLSLRLAEHFQTQAIQAFEK
jgi:hypothetical protein